MPGHLTGHQPAWRTGPIRGGQSVKSSDTDSAGNVCTRRRPQRNWGVIDPLAKLAQNIFPEAFTLFFNIL